MNVTAKYECSTCYARKESTPIEVFQTARSAKEVLKYFMGLEDEIEFNVHSWTRQGMVPLQGMPCKGHYIFQDFDHDGDASSAAYFQAFVDEYLHRRFYGW